jgi:hypothetical protein
MNGVGSQRQARNAAVEAFAGLIVSVNEDDLPRGRSSRWSARDVVAHLIGCRYTIRDIV